MIPRKLVVLFITILILLFSASARAGVEIYGTWRFNKEESTDIAIWGRRILYLDIRDQGSAITIVHDWQRRGDESWTDSLTISPGHGPVTQIVESSIWPENWFMGVLSKVGSEKTTKATWLEVDRRLVTETERVVEVSQGEATISATCEYALGRDGDTLILTERRSRRPTPVRLVFERVAEETGE